MLMLLVNKLEEKVDMINDKMNVTEARSSTDELSKIMEAAETSLMLSLKNKEDIEKNKSDIQKNEYERSQHGKG